VFATVLAFAFCPLPLPEAEPDGVRAGNKPAALPPGLNIRSMVLLDRYGRLPTDSGEVVVSGVPTPVSGVPAPAGAAVTATVTDATGSTGRYAALAVTVSLTDVTADALAATVACATTSRWGEFASTAPRSHDPVPLWLPQPKLKFGVMLAGEAARWTMASGTLPFCVQALTAHRADSPRVMDVCRLCTATQRLTFAEAEYAASAAAVAGLELGEGEPAVADVVGDGSAVGLGVVVGDGLVVVGVGLGEVVGGLVVVVPLAVGVGVLEVAVGVGVGVDRVGVGVGDGLGGGAGSRSGWHP
jgi:hypothetical protein